MKSHRTRANWGLRRRRTIALPLVFAALVGLGLLVLGGKMLRNQEKAAILALEASAQGVARGLGPRIESAILADGLSAAGRPEEGGGARPAEQCPIGFLLQPKPADLERDRASNRACTAMAEALPTASREARKLAEDELIRSCPTVRGPLGTLLVPEILIARRDESGLRGWLEEHHGDVGSVDRRSLRTSINDAAFERTGAPPPLALLSLLAMKGARASLRDRTLVAQIGNGTDPLRGETTIGRWSPPTNTRDAIVAILDPDELIRCAPSRFQLPPDLRLQIADPSGRDREGTIRLAPELLLEVVPRGPEVIALRTKETRLVLGSLFALAVALGAALTALLARKAQKAEDLAELRTDFAAAIAHELRTPLTSMRILTELLAGESLSDADRRTASTSLLEQTKRLSSTAERMLTLRSLMVGKQKPTPESVDLSELLEGAILDFATRAPTVAVERAFPRNVECKTDPALLRIIVDNLMDNALKYAGGPTSIAVHDRKGSWEIEVCDRGPGVPDEAKGRLFEPFERADARLSEQTKGAGLGLAIVKYASDAIGATVGVRDAVPKGAIFFVRIPKNVKAGGQHG